MTSQFFVHPLALVESTDIGAGTRIWAFSHVMPDVRVGRDCNIGEQCFLESGVTIGDSVVIKNGVAIWQGVDIENGVFVGPNVAFTNDLIPRAKLFRSCVKTLVREGASIGANATIRCGVEIGRWAMIGAGSVVTKDVPEFAVVIGNPGHVSGYICRCGERLAFHDGSGASCGCGLKFTMQNGVVINCEMTDRNGDL